MEETRTRYAAAMLSPVPTPGRYGFLSYKRLAVILRQQPCPLSGGGVAFVPGSPAITGRAWTPCLHSYPGRSGRNRTHAAFAA